MTQTIILLEHRFHGLATGRLFYIKYLVDKELDIGVCACLSVWLSMCLCLYFFQSHIIYLTQSTGLIVPIIEKDLCERQHELFIRLSLLMYKEADVACILFMYHRIPSRVILLQGRDPQNDLLESLRGVQFA